jgi:hypothetical protein
MRRRWTRRAKTESVKTSLASMVGRYQVIVLYGERYEFIEAQI